MTMDNGRVRVEVDLTRACIASITDLGTGRQVVAAEPTVGFNGYVYDRYGTAGGFNHLANKTSTDDELGLLGSRATGRPAALVSREVTPVSESLTYEFGADGVRWVRVTLTLARDSRVLTIENRLSKPATMARRAPASRSRSPSSTRPCGGRSPGLSPATGSTTSRVRPSTCARSGTGSLSRAGTVRSHG